MALIEKQIIFAHNLNKFFTYLFDSGYQCTLGEAWRTDEQAKIYASQGKGIVNSLHCKRLAIDINIFRDGQLLNDILSLEPLGKYWESLHKLNRFGGHFHDRPDSDHFEMQDL